MALHTRLSRLARLEALENVQRFPTTFEMHDCTPVGVNDRRRGSIVVSGDQVTFHCATADEYKEASRKYAADRHIIVISIDARCIDFKQEGAAQ